jgi:two-component system, cell cycle response regulator DivK
MDPVNPGHETHRVPDGRAGIVLVADDSFDAREMYALYFQHRGYGAYTAEDGDAAVHMARDVRPDLIVMDLSMPRVDGITATKRLKEDPRTQSIPVILLTGHPSKAAEHGALEAGVAIYLTKPCLPEDLEQHVSKILRAR